MSVADHGWELIHQIGGLLYQDRKQHHRAGEQQPHEAQEGEPHGQYVGDAQTLQARHDALQQERQHQRGQQRAHDIRESDDRHQNQHHQQRQQHRLFVAEITVNPVAQYFPHGTTSTFRA
jgi:hypothetical protein